MVVQLRLTVLDVDVADYSGCECSTTDKWVEEIMYAVTVVQRMGAQMVRAQAHRRWGHWRNGVDPTVDHFADCLEPSVFSKRIPASLIAAAHCMVKCISWMRTAQPV